jgi:hypothetical protein
VFQTTPYATPVTSTLLAACPCAALGSNIPKDKISTIEFCGEHLSLYRDPQGVVQCSKYPVRELGNVVFVYRGEAEELPKIWHPPQFQQPGWRHFYGEVPIRANHWMVFENVIDMAHVLIVHKEAAPGLDKLPDVLVGSLCKSATSSAASMTWLQHWFEQTAMAACTLCTVTEPWLHAAVPLQVWFVY